MNAGFPDQSRRQFLRGRLRSVEAAIRLPWTVDEESFITHCTQCGDCVDSCPQKIIHITDGGYPAINFDQSECTFCRSCIDICCQPMFTDHQILPPWSAELKIGNNCFVEQNVFCQSCRDSCEQNAIRFNYVAGSPIPRPSVFNESCNGCGSCLSVCPTKATKLRISYV